MDEQGLNDAAIFLMSLGEEEAAEVFKHLSPKEVQKLGETIARTRSVSRDRVDDVVNKFTEAAAQQSLLVSDTGDYVKAVLRRALGDDKASLLIDRILQGGDVSGIESLKWMDPLSVAELLRNEHPQIVAAILVHLDYEQAAAVLFKVLAGGDTIRKTSLGGIKTAAEIINLMGSNIEGTVLESIRGYAPDLAQKIMDKMFVFDDVMKLDDKAIQMVLKEVASETLIVALKGAAPELKERFLSNMSSRAAETLREDLESRGPMRLSEVEAQQKEILKTVRRLADEGQIVIGGGGDDQLV